MDLYVWILLWNSLSFSCSTRQLVDISERVEPVMGETFFGPKELLDSAIPDMEVFKRVFTLPKESPTSIYITGNISEICDKLANLSSDVDTLVINVNIKLSDSRDTFFRDQKDCGYDGSQYIYFYGLHSNITELWLLDLAETNNGVYIVLDPKLTSLKIVHIISKTHDIGMNRFSLTETQVLHLHNVYYDYYSGERSDSPSGDTFVISDLLCPNLSVLAINYAYTINASMVIENYPFAHPLEYLALSGELVRFPLSLASDFPELKALYMLHILHHGLDYYTFYSNTLLFHRNLQLFVLDFSLENCDKNKKSRKIFGNLDKIFGDKSFEMADCAWILNPDFSVNQTMQCRFLKCWLGQRFLCNEIFFTGNKESMEVKFPLSRKLHEFYCRGLGHSYLSPLWFLFTARQYIQLVLGYLRADDNFCSLRTTSKNSLVKVDYSQMDFDELEDYFSWHNTDASSCLGDKVEITGLENIEILYLNDFRLPRQEHLYGILNHSVHHKLKSVELRNNQLRLPIGLRLCLNQQNLESVDLSFNEINEIPMHFLRDCRHLKYLNLSHNQIGILPISVHEDMERLDITVDLSSNPLNCDCHPDAIETLRHLHANKHKFEAFHEYVCFGHGQHLIVSGIDLDVHLAPCDRWTLQEIVGLCTGSSTATALLGVIIWLSIKYRYRILKFLYNSRRKLRCKTATHQKFPFDLYLVYDRDDRCFVHNIFIKAMEDISGFKCCVPFRDFPGEGIQSEFIHRYMDASRYVVVMLSRVSINKYWTAFEIERAQDLERRQGKTIFYVKLDNLGSDITHEVKKVLDSGNFTEWPKDFRNDNKGVQFFNKLIAEIHSEELCDVCCTCTTPSSRQMPLDDQIVEMHIYNE